MLEVLFELLFEFFGEFVLQIGFELLGEAFKTGWYRLTGRNKHTTPLQEVMWSLGSGLACGLLTLALFPALALRVPSLQILNLLLAPLAAGLLVERVRAWREARGVFSVPVFAYAALFGVAFALTRWVLGR